MKIEKIEKMISKTWHNAKVENVTIDNEFGCITATIDGKTYIDCGWVEDYCFNGRYYHEC